ncbi:hypothetical protein U1Q18_001502 [Sarracenia purpurea var. burkii]
MNGAWFRQQQWWIGARERDGVAVRRALGAMLGEDSGTATRGPRFKGERVDYALLMPKPSELMIGEGGSIVGNRSGRKRKILQTTRVWL